MVDCENAGTPDVGGMRTEAMHWNMYKNMPERSARRERCGVRRWFRTMLKIEDLVVRRSRKTRRTMLKPGNTIRTHKIRRRDGETYIIS
jgi:hypothetical protein